MVDVPQIIEIFELVMIFSLAACTAWLARRSMPATLEARQRRIEAIPAEVSAKLAEIMDERALWKVQGERLAEEVHGYLDQIERKRSSTAASASRISAAQPAQVRVEDMSRAQQIAYARRNAAAAE